MSSMLQVNETNFHLFQWVPEITHHCQKTPFLLVGTQIDLRDDASTIEKLAKNRQKPVSSEMGDRLARELRAVKYVECSALTQVSRCIYSEITQKYAHSYLYVICCKVCGFSNVALVTLCYQISEIFINLESRGVNISAV